MPNCDGHCAHCGQMMNAKVLNFEIMATLSCDMRCHYCFGKPGLKVPTNNEGAMKPEVWDKIFDEIDNISDKAYYKDDKYYGVSIHFFGGEPALSVDKITEMMERYKERDDVVFKMVTNGQHLEALKPLCEKFSRLHSNTLRDYKFTVQLSYDGNPIHDIKRRDCNGNPTSSKVKEHIAYMQENGFPYTMKSAITYDTFKYMYEAYEDYLQVSKDRIRYFPTIDQSVAADTYSMHLSEDKQKEYRDDLERSLLKIAKKEISYARSHANVPYNPRFEWFTNSKKLCGMGFGYITVGIDGAIYPCHSSAYGSNESVITSIFDKDKDNKISEAFKYFSKLKYNSEKCLKCDTDYCLKCPAEAFSLSEKETNEEKYIDYGFNEYRCSLYRMASKIKRALYCAL